MTRERNILDMFWFRIPLGVQHLNLHGPRLLAVLYGVAQNQKNVLRWAALVMTCEWH